MKLNAQVTERRYELMVRSISHEGFQISDYDSYRPTGSLENICCYVTKALVTQLFWAILILTIPGVSYLMAWYAALFITTALIRNFDWRQHGGNFRNYKNPALEFDTSNATLNQRFYGFIASEWHNNHHKYPSLGELWASSRSNRRRISADQINAQNSNCGIRQRRQTHF